MLSRLRASYYATNQWLQTLANVNEKLQVRSSSDWNDKFVRRRCHIRQIKRST